MMRSRCWAGAAVFARVDISYCEISAEWNVVKSGTVCQVRESQGTGETFSTERAPLCHEEDHSRRHDPGRRRLLADAESPRRNHDPGEGRQQGTARADRAACAAGRAAAGPRGHELALYLL